MEEMKIGEYVRTKEGFIFKITEENINACNNEKYLNKIELFDFIINHSFNIIDLIEPGDVINYYSNYSGNEIKMEVDYICCKKDDYKWGLGYVSTHYDDYVYIEDIKSICTKEQFEAVEYKLDN